MLYSLKAEPLIFSDATSRVIHVHRVASGVLCCPRNAYLECTAHDAIIGFDELEVSVVVKSIDRRWIAV
jgi:hypothetical protein